nr:ATP-binding protein [Lacticaseibacillus hulanensis]
MLLGIHLLFIALTALTTGWVRVLILCALALTLVLVTTLLDYLFRETDMVYAQSLDKIMANYTTEINGLYASIRGWRHDYHDHLQALKYYLHDDELTAARDYLNQLEDKLEDIDDIVHSGNTVMDAVVNSKLALAEQANIATDVSVFVGHQPLISDIDLVVILGNILDNAIEAASEQPEEADRFIRVYIAIEKQQLYISITNSRRADQIIDINYASTKNDKRGLGIRRINALVAKYHGIINRQYEEGVFVTEVLLPLKQITK